MINHGILMKKLKHYGVRDPESDWFSGYLCRRRQRIKVNDVKSEWTYIVYGIPQAILGLLFFSIYMSMTSLQ